MPRPLFSHVLNLQQQKTGTTALTDGAVTTPKLAIGAAINAIQVGSIPGGLAGTAVAWTTILSMPAITTRGGLVAAVASGGWSIKGPSNTNAVGQVRWIRDPGTVVLNTLTHESYATSNTLTQVPLPPLISLDTPNAGTWTYRVQYQLAGASFFVSPASGGGICWVVEFA